MKQRKQSKQQKLFSLKSMYYQRYLLLHYSIACIFFTNLYWCISLHNMCMIIPMLLCIGCVFSCIESVTAFEKKHMHTKWTSIVFKLQLFANICFMIIGWSPFSKYLYPFLTVSLASSFFISGLCIMGIILSYGCLHRLHNISLNKDKHYQRIKEYEKIINIQL